MPAFEVVRDQSLQSSNHPIAKRKRETIVKSYNYLFAVVLTACVAGSTSADLFRVTGDLFDNTPTKRGSFEIVIDEADLTSTLTNAEPRLFPLETEPWYGYDVTSATLTFDGFTLTDQTADIVPQEPNSLGPTAEFYIEGAPIADLDTESFLFGLTPDLNTFPSFILLGLSTTSDNGNGVVDFIFEQISWDTGSTSGDAFASQGGGVQNVSVTAIPEPSAFLYGGLISGIVGCGVRVRRRSI